MTALAILFSGLIIFSGSARAANATGRFSVQSRLVLVPVTVTDDRGAPVTGLGSDAFTILEGNAPRPIVSFTEEDVPCSVGVILDLSGSMKDRLDVARSALRTFSRFAEAKDEAFLMTVSDHPVTRTGFSSDFGNLLNPALFSQASGSTALVDTIYLGLANTRRGRNPRKAMLVISDGMDNHSRYSFGELYSAAMESDIQIHTIVLAELPVNAKGREVEERTRGVLNLKKLSSKTGGLHYTARRDSDLTQAAHHIGRSIRSQYVIGYRPEISDTSGKWTPIKVKLNVPRSRAHARVGYYSD